MKVAREPPIAVPKGCSGSACCKAWGADEARVLLIKEAGNNPRAAVDGGVLKAEGLGASRVHDGRWGGKAQANGVDLR